MGAAVQILPFAAAALAAARPPPGTAQPAANLLLSLLHKGCTCSLALGKPALSSADWLVPWGRPGACAHMGRMQPGRKGDHGWADGHLHSRCLGQDPSAAAANAARSQAAYETAPAGATLLPQH